MRAARLGEQALEGVAEGGVLVAVDDPGTAVDRLIGENLPELRERVAVLPLRVGGAEHRGDPESLSHLRQPDHVRLVGRERGEVAYTHQPDLVVDQRITEFCGVGLS